MAFVHAAPHIRRWLKRKPISRTGTAGLSISIYPGRDAGFTLRPPDRSEHALLTHSAPTSGV